MFAAALRRVPAALGRATMRVNLANSAQTFSTKTLAASAAPLRAWTAPTKVVFSFAAVAPLAALVNSNVSLCKEDRSKGEESAIQAWYRTTRDKVASAKLPTSGDQVGQSASEMADNIIKQNIPLKLGIGFIFGFTSAFALKRIGRVVLFLVGSLVIIFQVCAYLGWISVNYKNIGQDFGVAFDLDEDGEVGQEDLMALKDLILGILSANLAGSGGFAAGFSLGMRY